MQANKPIVNLTGRVAWYDASKGYGVISGGDGETYFVHYSNVEEGALPLQKGQEVVFDARPRSGGRNGMEAYHLKRSAKKAPPEKPRNAALEIPARKPEPSSGSDYWLNMMQPGGDRSKEVEPARKNNLPIVTKVVGVTYEDRQKVVERLEIGEVVQLVRQPLNPYDRNAIAVVRMNGQQIGFLSRELAALLARHLDALQEPLSANVSELTGGYSTYSSRGVVIRFYPPDG